VVERRNQSVMNATRCMMKVKKLPSMFWGEVVNCAVYLLNRTTSKSTGDCTPYELRTGSKANVNHLRVFGCIAHVKTTAPNLKKLDDRIKPMIFIGNEPGSAAYRCYDPNTKRVHISRDVIFDEEGIWDWSSAQVARTDSEFVVGGQSEGFQTTLFTKNVVVRPGELTTEEDAEQHVPIGDEGMQVTPPAMDRGSAQGRSPVSAARELQETPPSENLDAEHDDAPLRFRKLSEILGPGSPPGQAARGFEGQLFLGASEEPTTFNQAQQHLSWRKAMLDEISSIEENKTWKLVDLPTGHKPIGLKWEFKLKKDAKGVIVKHKARLVAKGYSQTLELILKKCLHQWPD
jgi:hypothetical protein